MNDRAFPSLSEILKHIDVLRERLRLMIHQMFKVRFQQEHPSGLVPIRIRSRR